MADAITQLQNDIEAQEAEGMRLVLVAAAQAALVQSRVMFSMAGNVKHDLTCARHTPTEQLECQYTGRQLLEFELNRLTELVGASELSHLEEAQASVPRWVPDDRELPKQVAALGLLLAEEMSEPAEKSAPGSGQVLLALANFESRCPDRDLCRRARRTALLAHAVDALYDIRNVEEDALQVIIYAGDELISVWWNPDGMVTTTASTRRGNLETWQSEDTDWDFRFRVAGALSSAGDEHEFTIG